VINALKYDIDYNIATGARMLALKWDATPRIGDGDKSKLENWYFALWAYNSWSVANNPRSAAARGRVAYQDKILKLMNTAYLGELTPPVAVTPIPLASLPAGLLPGRGAVWPTPEPAHTTRVAAPARGGAETVSALFARISGVNRFDTAANIAVTGWLSGCPTVILTERDDFLSALAAIPLSKKEGAPILLTETAALDHRAERALRFLQPEKVILLGRELSGEIENQIRALLPQARLERIGGNDPYETAALIAAGFPAGRSAALVADVASPAALSLATAAAAAGSPLLLTGRDSLPPATQTALASLRPSALLTVGGENLLAASVLDEALRFAALPAEALTFYGGADEYAAAAAVTQAVFPRVGKIFLASGETLADALGGAALAAQQSVPLLLVPATGVEPDGILADYLRSLPAETEMEIFGGEAAVPDSAAAAVRDLLGADAE
jgi:putative cell wall-binding protein